MARRPQISRSFPVLTLAMAVPLVAIMAFVAYDRYVKDDGPNDGWQTYRDDRLKFQIRLPANWRLESQSEGDSVSKPGLKSVSILFSDPDHPSTVGWALHARIRIVPQGDWCVGSNARDVGREITLDGLKGTENVCYLDLRQPFSVMRDFTKDGKRVWVVGETSPFSAAADDEYAIALKVVQSFRFVD